MTWTQLLFSGKGRIGRKDFWSATLLLVVLATPLRLLGPLGNILALVFLFPQICLFSKRLHDLGKSGWLAAAVYGPPVPVAFAVGLLGGESGDPPLLVSIASSIGMIACVVFFFRVGLAKGGVEPNAYGAAQISRLSRKDVAATF